MFWTIFLSYLPYSLVTTITPGPNNLMSFYSVSHSGWKKGSRTILGMTAGFFSVMLICAFACYQLEQYLPEITGVMKYLGAAYILYLGLHIILTKSGTSEGEKASFFRGFVLQFVNAKVILCGVTRYTCYVLPYTQNPGDLVLHGAAFALIGLACFCIWALFGKLLSKLTTKYDKPFRIAMGIILWICGIRLFL
ncbi:MAG: LysE family transporter [Lachnospiraceae bacterium]|nr:LysE family transporter [Lachnospiraceae bacterium]